MAVAELIVISDNATHGEVNGKTSNIGYRIYRLPKWTFRHGAVEKALRVDQYIYFCIHFNVQLKGYFTQFTNCFHIIGPH